MVDKAAKVALEHPAVVKTLAGYGILRDKIPPSPIHTLKTVETIRPIKAPFFLGSKIVKLEDRLGLK